MKVLHVISGIDRAGGGPSRSSQGLVAGLRSVGVDAWLLTLNHGEEPWIKGCEKFVNGGSFEATIGKVKPDIVHLHGVWDVGIHRCAVICRRRGIPYAIAPRGMLEPWSLKQKWLKKRVARFLYQDRDLKKAAALHATAESEVAQFRALGFKNYCIISPNGVNLPDKEIGTRKEEVGSSKEVRGEKRALFVSRMHPKKGVLELVESWARVKPRGWVCELVYTLNGDTEKVYEVQVKRRVKELGLEDQFIFTGALDDDAKWEAYGRADLFVLPTYSENFGIVVAEALWAGVPVITTKGTPWKDLLGADGKSGCREDDLSADERCGWWIELPKNGGVDDRCRMEWPALDRALRAACGTEGLCALSVMGENGHRLVETKYTWKAVVEAMVRGYEQVLNMCNLKH